MARGSTGQRRENQSTANDKMNCLPFLMSKKWEAVHMRGIMILQRVSVGF